MGPENKGYVDFSSMVIMWSIKEKKVRVRWLGMDEGKRVFVVEFPVQSLSQFRVGFFGRFALVSGQVMGFGGAGGMLLTSTQSFSFCWRDERHVICSWYTSLCLALPDLNERGMIMLSISCPDRWPIRRRFSQYIVERRLLLESYSCIEEKPDKHFTTQK
jgi:hypothetical protein